MRRFSIAKMMSLVALLAANFAALKLLQTDAAHPEWAKAFLVGLLPLLNVQLLAIYFALKKFRIAIRRRSPGQFWPAVAYACMPFVMVAGFLCAFDPETLVEYLERVAPPLERVWAWTGVSIQFDSPFEKAVVVPLFLGMMVSGPLIAVAVVLGFVRSRFKLVVTSREEDPCDASPSSI